MTIRRSAFTGAVLATVSTVAMLANATTVAAQPASGYDQGPPPGYDQGPPPQGDYDRGAGPPQGQYAPPPPEAQMAGAYDERTQQSDREYAQRYSEWAAQNCVDRRHNNTAAGAVIGGILGAVIGGNVAGRGEHFGGAVVGGALGATAGAAVGSASTDTRGCPPGYAIRVGAPAFYYGAPGYGYGYAPGWYNPWVWSGGVWVYRPYRAWYWGHPRYWRPGFHGRAWRDRYHRW
jgi:hypothetical protein